jgi:hypothetical protein
MMRDAAYEHAMQRAEDLRKEQIKKRGLFDWIITIFKKCTKKHIRRDGTP